jgi:hypothetical protein
MLTDRSLAHHLQESPFDEGWMLLVLLGFLGKQMSVEGIKSFKPVLNNISHL